MGVYRWYLVFSLIAYSALSYSATRSQIINAVPPSFLMSRSANVDQLTDAQCQAKPEFDGIMPNSYKVPDGTRYALLNGCIYKASTLAVQTSDGYYSNWIPLYAYIPPGDGDDDSGGDTGDTGDTGGDSTQPTEPDNPGVTPPVKPPVKPPVNPDSNSVAQLLDQYLQCSTRIHSYPQPNYDDYNPAIDYEYNAEVRQCNSVYDRLTSLVKSGSVNAGSDDNHDFITGDGSGSIYKCIRNPYTPQQMADMGRLYPGEILGHQIVKNSEREIGFNCHEVLQNVGTSGNDDKNKVYKNKCDWHLNFNYTIDDGKGTSVCNSVYSSSLGAGDSDGSSQGGSCPAGTFNVPGSGCEKVQCQPGFHPVAGATSSDYPSCEADSSSGDTGSGDDSGPGLSTPSLDVPDLTLAPLWNIWPSARDFKLTLPAAQCPVFNIEVFGTNHKIDTFCTIFTPDIIAIIRAICILTASIIAFIIVLRS
ncbi:hypothetical protein CSL77_000189 [Salmonella enterica subsp. diarizonae]|nr:hypothetical protein [Salmonella enterica subsp. diarizonae]EGH9329477.1 hypothetical protein [Salmonella enterica]ECI4299874.1 hypothetical protein [Salmonella enterica subsp. diarizonae]ECI5307236.1 hypothetical protein [Salmonella enterica subsp. diarizonae]EDQ8167839.1 hypothetical protein [Salmonella enterica subsp. diarizonae]